MNVSVRLGAGLNGDQVERRRFDLHLAADATVQEAVDALKVLAPNIGQRISAAVFVVSGQTVDRAHILHEGDEVSVVVPLAGGLLIARVERRN
jgi:molybdopterin converting factor small subunit